MRFFLLVLGWLFVSACRCVVPLPQAMNDLRNAGYVSWSSDDDLSLITPWSEEDTAVLRRELGDVLRAIEAEFQTQLPRPVHIVLNPVEEEEEGDREKTVSSIHGVEAYAVASENTIVFFVAPGPENREDEAHLERTLQHELAHLVASQLGVEGKTWFDEGLAIEVEYANLREKRLQRELEPEPLRMARRVHETVSLDEVLHWAESGRAILKGEEEAFWAGRPLAHSLMRFLLVRRGASFGERGGFLEALLEIHRMNEGEILALEPEWHAWLEEGPGGS